jgi:hypothetical protein
MTLTELLLIRGGYTPAQLGLPDDVHDPLAPRGLPARARLYDANNPVHAHLEKRDVRANAGRPPGASDRIPPAPVPWPLTRGQAEAQRHSECALVRAAERERDERRARVAACYPATRARLSAEC